MLLLLSLLTLACLPQSAGVRGVVLDHRGQPLQGAHVFVADSRSTHDWPVESAAASASGDRPVRHGYTDAEGRFTLSRLQPGAARLVVRAENHATLRLDRVRLGGQGTTNLGSVQLAEGAVLKGRVFDAQGEGLSKARIYSFPHADRSQGRGVTLAAFETETDVRGEFELNSLPLGEWTLLIEDDEHPAHRFEGVLHQREFHTERLPFVLRPGVFLRGRVDTLTSVRNLSMLEVRAIPAEELIRNGPNPTYSQGYITATVERTGTFKIGPLRDETLYLLRAQQPAQSFLTEDAWAPMGVSRSDADSVRLEWLPSSKITFRALDVATAGAPTPYKLTVVGATPGEPFIDHASGNKHVIENVRPKGDNNVFVLHASANGYREFTSRQLELVTGQTIRAGDISLWQHPTVTVHVTDRETGSPVVGARLVLKETEAIPPPRRTARAVTDTSGRAKLNLFPGSPLALGVFADGRAPRIFLSPFEPIGQEFPVELEPGLDLAAQILNSDGDPLVGYGVRRTYGEDDEAFLFAGTDEELDTVYTDDEGIAWFHDLGELEYAFSLEDWDRMPGQHLPQRVLPIPGPMKQITFGLDPVTTLTARILEGNVPLSAAEMGLDGLRVRTNGEGRLRFDSVWPGPHRFLIRHPNRVMDFADELFLEVTKNELEIHLPVGAINGQVADLRGAPVAGAEIYLYEKRWLEPFDVDDLVGKNLFRAIADHRGKPVAVTDAEGLFNLHGVRDALGMTVSARTLDGFSAGVRVRGIKADGEVSTGPIVVRPPARLKVLALNEPIRPKTILTLVATFHGEAEAGGWPRILAPYTGQSWRLNDLPAGWWEFTMVSLNDYGEVIDSESFGRIRLEPNEDHEYSLDH